MSTSVMFIRKGSTIQSYTSDKRTVYKSINKAKKASRELQLSTDGRLGGGCLVAVPDKVRRSPLVSGGFKLFKWPLGKLFIK